MQGKLILVVGPAGSGKSVLLSHLKAVLPEVVFPVSCTTRPMRPGEVEGQTYYYVSEEEFIARVERGEFLEWVHTDGKRYGTLRSEIVPALMAGKVVVREVEPRGVASLLAEFGTDVVRTIYIDAGDWSELQPRIVSRAPISPEELQSRQERYEAERTFMTEADVVVQNADGELAQAEEKFVAEVRRLGGL